MDKWSKWRYNIFFTISFFYKFRIGLCKFWYFLIRCILSWCKKVLFMIGKLFQVFNFLFAIKHLPALNTKNLAIRFCFNCVQTMDECIPFCWISLYHCLVVLISSFTSHLLFYLFLLFFLYFYVYFFLYY